MIRLTLLLCAGLYFGFLVLGEDHGQKRHALMLAEAPPAPEPAAPEAPAPLPEAVVFIPAKTVMEPTPVVVAAAPAVIAPSEPAASPEPQVELAAAPETPAPEPPALDGALFVATTGANVRSGPGKSYGVLDSLAAGEQVLVVADDNPTDGWLRIRLEGDGVEGYVAERLLTALP